MVHAKNEVPATANNAEINIFNFSFILFSFSPHPINIMFFVVPNRKRHFNSAIHNEREPKPIGAKQ